HRPHDPTTGPVGNGVRARPVAHAASRDPFGAVGVGRNGIERFSAQHLDGSLGCREPQKRQMTPNGNATKAQTIAGTLRRSRASDARQSPTMSTPRRMANRLNDVDSAVKRTEAAILVASLRVPAIQCATISMACPAAGSRIIAVSMASHAGDARLNASVM